MAIVADELRIPVPIAEDGKFILPVNKAAEEADAGLIVNRKKNDVGWRPFISTGIPSPTTLRLGDVRLLCEVYWAIEQADQPFFVRNGLRLLGTFCRSANMSLIFTAEKKLAAITMTSGERRVRSPYKVPTRNYALPLHDRSWNDDTVVGLEYAPDSDPAPSEKAPQTVTPVSKPEQ